MLPTTKQPITDAKLAVARILNFMTQIINVKLALTIGDISVQMSAYNWIMQ